MLAAMESLKGNFKELRIHMKALTKMVRIRGVRTIKVDSYHDAGSCNLFWEQKVLGHVFQLLFILESKSTNHEFAI